MDTEGDFKYWPYDKIPVISETALEMLEKNTDYETGRDGFGGHSIKLIIFDKCIEVPKFLTSKGALAFLGFTHTRAEQLWTYLINVPPSMDGPDIEDGGEYYFWKGTVEFLDVKISLAKEPAINRGRDSKALLDDVGLTNKVQLQELRITSDYDESILTCLQAQMPEDALPLAKQYIQHRWEILVGLEDIITKRVDWREDTVKKFTQHPIDLMAADRAESPRDFGTNSTPDEELYDEAF